MKSETLIIKISKLFAGLLLIFSILLDALIVSLSAIFVIIASSNNMFSVYGMGKIIVPLLLLIGPPYLGFLFFRRKQYLVSILFSAIPISVCIYFAGGFLADIVIILIRNTTGLDFTYLL